MGGLFTIGDIIVLIVLAAVILTMVVFRRMDRNNRSLEKVKRFSDKVLEDLQAVASEREARLNDIAIEVDVHQQASKKVLERLLESETALDAKSQSMEELRGRMDAYNAALLELVNMTQKAEENIARLRDESAYIDKVGRRIRSASGQLTQIEERLPQLLGEIQAQNHTALQETQNDIVQTFTARVEELDGQVRQAQQYAIDTVAAMRTDVVAVQNDLAARADAYRRAFDEIERDYGSRLAKAATEGKTLESDVLAALRASFEASVQGLENQLSQHGGSLTDNLQSQEAALTKRLQEMASFIEAAGAELRHDVQRLQTTGLERIGEIETAIHQNIDRRATDLAAEIELTKQAIDQAASDREAALRNVEAGNAEALEAFVAQIRNEVAAKRAEVEAELVGYRREMAAWQVEMQGATQEGQEELERKVAEVRNSMDAEVQSLGDLVTRSRDDMERLVNEIEDARIREAEDYRKQLETHLQSLEQTATQARADLARQTTDVEAGMQAEVTALAQRVEQSRLEMARLLDGLNDENGQNLSGLAGRIQESRAEMLDRLQKINEEHEQNLAAFRRELAEGGRTLEQTAAAEQQELARRVTEVQSTMQGDVSALADLIDQSRAEMRRLLQEVDAVHVREADDFRGQIRERVTALEGDFSQVEQEVADKLHGVQSRGVQLAESLLGRINQEVEAKTDAMREAINQQVEEVNSRVAASHGQIDQSFSALRQRVDGWIQDSQAYMADLDAKVHQLNEESRQANAEHQATVEHHIADTRDRLNAYEQGLSSRVQTLESFITRAEQLIQEEFSRIEQTAHDLAVRNAADLDELWEKNRQDMVDLQSKRLGVLRTDLDAEQVALVNTVGGIRDKFESELVDFRDHLAQSLAENNRRMDEIASMEDRMQSALTGWQGAIAGLEREHRDLLVTMQDRLTQDREASAKAVRDDIGFAQAALEVGLATVRDDLNDRLAELRDSAKSMELALADEFRQGIQNVQQQAQGLYTQIQKDLDLSFGGQQNRVQNLVSTIEADIERLQSVSAQSAAKIGAWEQGIKDGEERIRQDILAVRDQAVQVATQQADQVRSEYQRQQTELTKQYQDMDEQISATVQKLKSEINHAKGDVEQDLDFLRQQIVQVKGSFQEQVSDLQASAKQIEEEAIADLRTRIESLREEARELTRKYQDEFAVGMQTIQGSIAGQMEQYQAELKRTQALAGEIQNQFRGIKEESDRHVQVLRTAMEQEQQGAGQLLKVAKEQFAAQVEQSQKQLLEQLKNVVDTIGGETVAYKSRGDKAVQDMAAQVAAWQTDFAERLKALQTDATGMRREALAGMQERVDSLRDESRQMTGALKQEITQLLDEHRSAIEGHIKASEGEFVRVQDMHNATKVRFQEIQEILEKAEATAKSELEVVRDRTRTLAEQARAGLQTELQEQRDELANQIRIGLQEVSAQAAAGRAQILESITKARSQAEGEMKADSEALAKLRADLASTIKAALAEQEMATKTALDESAMRLEQSARLTTQVESALSAIREDLSDKTGNLEKMLEQYASAMGQAIIQRSEEREQGALADIEKRLREYEGAIGYRITKLESVNDDMDGLESAMRQSIDLLASRIKDDMAKQGAEFQAKRQEDMDSARKDFEALRLEMLGVERGIDDLKKKAYDNVSEKLKVFEDEFFVDIGQRSDKMQSQFDAWQNQVQDTLAKLAADAGAERAKLEAAYVNKMQSGLEEIQRDLAGRFDKIEGQFTSFNSGLTQRMDGAGESIDAFRSKLGAEVEALEEKTQTYVQNQFVKVQQELEQRLRSFENDADLRLGRVDQDTKTRASEIQQVLDAVRSDVTSWQNQVLQQIKNGESQVQQDLTTLQARSKEVIDDLAQDFSQQKDAAVMASVQERAELRRELTEAEDRLDKLSQELDRRSREILESTSKQNQTFVEEIARQNQELTDDVEDRIRQYKTFAASTREEFETMQRRLVSKLEDDTKVLDLNLREIDKRVKAFTQQTQLFERSDTLKVELETRIAELRKEIEGMDAQKRDLLNLDPVIEKVRRLTEDVNDKFQKLSAEKKRLEGLDEQYKQLASLSQLVDQKLQQVTSASDTLSQMQLSLRQIDETQKAVGAKLDRLESKAKVAETTSDSIERNFNALHSMEERLAELQSTFGDLPGRVQEVQERITSLTVHKKDADAALRSLVNLDKIMKDVEARTDELTKARDWIARTETRMNEVSRDAQEHIELLSRLVQKEMKLDDSSGSKPTQSLGNRELVLKLANKGWKIDEIAKTTKLSRGEVELILEMQGST